MRTAEEQRIREALARVDARQKALPSVLKCTPDQYVETIRCEAADDALAWVLGDNPAWEFGHRAAAQAREDGRKRCSYVRQAAREP